MPKLLTKIGKQGARGQRFIMEFTYDEVHRLVDVCHAGRKADWNDDTKSGRELSAFFEKA